MSGHILIIEPDRDELRKLRELLSSEGYDIITASDIKTARQISKQLEISFVLGNANLLGFRLSTEDH